MLLENEEASLIRTKTRMFIAQPRRIAVHGLYRRLEPLLGNRVGKMMGHDKEMGPQTRIVYATTGSVLLKIAFHPEALSAYKYLIIDEGTGL